MWFSFASLSSWSDTGFGRNEIISWFLCAYSSIVVYVPETHRKKHWKFTVLEVLLNLKLETIPHIIALMGGADNGLLKKADYRDLAFVDRLIIPGSTNITPKTCK